MASRRPNNGNAIPVVGITPAAQPTGGFSSARPARSSRESYDDFAPLSAALRQEIARRKQDSEAENKEAGIKAAEEDFARKRKPNGELETAEEAFTRIGKKLNRLSDQHGEDFRKFGHYNRRVSELQADRAGFILKDQMVAAGKDLMEQMFDEDGIQVLSEDAAEVQYLEKMSEIDADLRGKAGGTLLESGGSERYFLHMREVEGGLKEQFLDSWREVRDSEVIKLAKDQVRGAWDVGGVERVNETLEATYAGGIGGPPAQSEKKQADAIVHVVSSIYNTPQTHLDGLVTGSPDAALDAIAAFKEGLKINGRKIKEGDDLWEQLESLEMGYENQIAELPKKQAEHLAREAERNRIVVSDIVLQTREAMSKASGAAPNSSQLSSEAAAAVSQHDLFKDNARARTRALQMVDEYVLNLSEAQNRQTRADQVTLEESVKAQLNDIRSVLLDDDLSDAGVLEQRHRLSQLLGKEYAGISIELGDAIRATYTEFDTSAEEPSPIQNVRSTRPVQELRSFVDKSSSRLRTHQTEFATESAERVEEHLRSIIEAEAESWDDVESPKRLAQMYSDLESSYIQIERDAENLRAETIEELDRQLANYAEEFDLSEDQLKSVSAGQLGGYKRNAELQRSQLQSEQGQLDKEIIRFAGRILHPQMDAGDPTLGDVPEAASLFKMVRGLDIQESAAFTFQMNEAARMFVLQKSAGYPPFNGSQGTVEEYKLKRFEDIRAATLKHLLDAGPEIHQSIEEQIKEEIGKGRARRDIASLTSSLSKFEEDKQGFVDDYNTATAKETIGSPTMLAFRKLIGSHTLYGGPPIESRNEYLFALSDDLKANGTGKSAALWGARPSDVVRDGVPVPMLPTAREMVEPHLANLSKQVRERGRTPIGQPDLLGTTAQALTEALDNMERSGRVSVHALFKELDGSPVAIRQVRAIMEEAVDNFRGEVVRVDVKEFVNAGTIFDWSEVRTARTSAKRLEDIKRAWFIENPRGGGEGARVKNAAVDLIEFEQLLELVGIDKTNEAEVDAFFTAQEQAASLFSRSYERDQSPMPRFR